MCRIYPLLLLLLGLGCMPTHAQRGGDMEAQILYAFQGDDTNQLSSLVQLLRAQEEAGGADAALRYDLAHAQYRLGLLAGGPRTGGPATAFAGCVNALKPLVMQQAVSAEVLILQAACYENLARVDKLERVLWRSRAEQELSAALALAPRNPRVLYLTAMAGLARSKTGSQENQRAFGRLQLAAHLFEQTSATSVDVPGWGHAEAYLDLGRQLALRGDVPGARHWIEKSLMMAPNYGAAQRQSAILIGG